MWTKLEVYNYNTFLDSFYTDSETKKEWIEEIDQTFGKGNWTKYNIGN